MKTTATDIKSFRDLAVYQQAFELQQMVFDLSKSWPRDEAYALTAQARRSSRSIGANLAESWGKRRYPAHLLSKLTDADGELQETSHWLSTAKSCGYIGSSVLSDLESRYSQLGKMLGSMMAQHEKFCVRASARW